MGHTQETIAQIISKDFNLTKLTGQQIIQRIMDIIADDIVYTGRIELRGLGTFSVSKRKAQNINHPSTGNPIHIPQKKILNFRSSIAIKRRLNPPKPKKTRKKRKS